MPELDLWQRFERERPFVLGALLDAVSAALRNLPETRLRSLPRLADFCLWVTAAEAGLGWKPGTFVWAYAGNQREANDLALDADPVARAVRRLMEGRAEWTGSATELWNALGERVDGEVKRSGLWPRAPHALSGRLNRLAPALRRAGIEYAEKREGHRRERVKTLRRVPAK